MKLLKIHILVLCGLLAVFAGPEVRAQSAVYPVSGRVIDRLTRQPVPYAAVVLAGQERTGVSTDSLGRFRIERVKPGIWRLTVSSMGYRSTTTSEYLVSAATPFIEEMEVLALKVARDLGFKEGEPIILVGGTPTGAGKTNFMRILNVNAIQELD